MRALSKSQHSLRAYRRDNAGPGVEDSWLKGAEGAWVHAQGSGGTGVRWIWVTGKPLKGPIENHRLIVIAVDHKCYLIPSSQILPDFCRQILKSDRPVVFCRVVLPRFVPIAEAGRPVVPDFLPGPLPGTFKNASRMLILQGLITKYHLLKMRDTCEICNVFRYLTVSLKVDREARTCPASGTS